MTTGGGHPDSHGTPEPEHGPDSRSGVSGIMDRFARSAGAGRALLEQLTSPADPRGLPPALADRYRTDPVVHHWATLLRRGEATREQALAGMAAALSADVEAMREQMIDHMHRCPPLGATPVPPR